MSEASEKSGKKPYNFRISEETAEKLREMSKSFTNQDMAFNALLEAFERETLMNEQPQFAEDIRQFEQYLRMLSLKYSDALNSLSSADDRARADVQSLLSSKDLMIQSLQEQVSAVKADKERSDTQFLDCHEEKLRLEESLSVERMANQGLESQMKEKEQQFAAALADKDRLNEILTTSVKEKQEEVDRLKRYADEIGILQEKISAMSVGMREAERKLGEAELHERMALLEQEKQLEREKDSIRRELEEKARKQQEKNEKEIERLRDLLVEMQEKLIGTEKRGK